MRDESARKLELLKLARTITNEEYINRRAEEHNRWVHQNDLSLMQTKMRAPYPAFTPYPSEDVIIIKALALYNFMMSTTVADVPESIELESISPTVTFVPLPEIQETVVDESPEPEPIPASDVPKLALVSVQEPIVDPVQEPIIDLTPLSDSVQVTMEPILEPVSGVGGWVKGWIRK